jgi:hypothetical protein
MNEAETRAEHIEDHGKPGEASSPDYLLRYRTTKLGTRLKLATPLSCASSLYPSEVTESCFVLVSIGS